MNRRRDFFKQLIGQIGVLHDTFRGVENIPLNRLNELPENIIENIEPVFFPEEIWHLNGRVLHIPESKFVKSMNIQLSEIELKALGCFKKRMKLKQSAIEIKKDYDLPLDEIYNIVKSFFLKLASLHICHPREIYHIDEIIKSKKNEG